MKLMAYSTKSIAVIVRQRGDARLTLEGLDFTGDPSFGNQPKRLRLSIQAPTHIDDEIEGRDNWHGVDRMALRLVELEQLIAALQKGREFLLQQSAAD